LPIGFAWWAFRNIKNYDIVYCHDFFTFQNIVSGVFCSIYNVPFIIQPHGTLSIIGRRAKSTYAKNIFLFLIKPIIKKASALIALTENEKISISSACPEAESKIVIIPNGIDFDQFSNIENIDIKNTYNIPRHNKVIGFLGRIQFIKGIDISIEILAHLKNKLDFTFLIIGPDEGDQKRLQKMAEALGIADRIIFTGIITGERKLSTIKGCDLFLLNSRSEGLPMTVLEIAALGIPQIISKNSNVPEIENCHCGYVVDNNNPKKASELVLRILCDNELWQKLSTNSKNLIEHTFSLKNTATKLNNVLKNIVKEK
jgi:glycosyltransferase involved in cell wall biosynthesis